MRLYLMRHGIAEDAHFGQPDHTRALTERGRERLAGQAAALRALAWPVEHLLTSPLIRSRQTAEIVAPAFGLEPVVEPRLGLGAAPEAYLAAAEDTGADHIFLVGHQPDLESAVYAFTGGAVRVRKGTIAVVDLSRPRRGGGRLVNLFDPEDFARLGEAIPQSP